MSLDVYELCPSLSGKKIKFTCRPFLKDVEKIVQLIDADQRVAALNHTRRTLQRHPDAEPLWALEARLLLELEDLAGLLERTPAFREKFPKSPVAWAMTVITMASSENDEREGKADRAMDALQRMLDCQPLVDGKLYLDDVSLDAISLAGLSMAHAGRPASAMACWGYYLSITRGGQGERDWVAQAFSETKNSEFPLMLMRPPMPMRSLEGERWESIRRLGGSGRWEAALRLAQEGLQESPGELAYLQAVACYLTLMGRPQATDAWRRILEHDGFEDWERVLAGVWESSLRPSQLTSLAFSAQETFPEQIRASDRVREASGPGENFLLLDRPFAETGEDAPPQAVPRSIAALRLIPRQTDAEPLLWATFLARHRTWVLDSLRELLGESLGEPRDEMDEAQPPRQPLDVTRFLVPQFQESEAGEAFRAKWLEWLLEDWAQQPHPSLGNRSPEQAAGDPTLRHRLSSEFWFVVLELLAHDISYDAVQAQASRLGVIGFGPNNRDTVLGLTTLEPSEVATPDLVGDFNLACDLGLASVVRRTGESLLQREDVTTHLDIDALYARIAVNLPVDSAESVRLLDQAVAAAEERERSPAFYRLSLLPRLISLGEVDRVREELQLIRRRHLREPGVAEHFQDLLVRLGFLNPDGSPAERPTPAPADSGAAEAPGGIWTPDAPAPASSGESESKLWLPGQD